MSQGAAKGGSGMGHRAQTEFWMTSGYEGTLDELQWISQQSYEQVLAKMEKFEDEYKASTSDSNISRGFEVKQIDNQPGEYHLKQVELTYDFRAAVLFPDGRYDAWWIDQWKKTRRRNTRELGVAKRRARQAWDNEIRRA